MNETDFAKAKIVPVLPDYFRAGRSEAFPADLVNAEVLLIGTIAESKAVEGGGLVIDYLPQGATDERRVVVAFNDLGMWVEWTGPLGALPISGALR